MGDDITTLNTTIGTVLFGRIDVALLSDIFLVTISVFLWMLIREFASNKFNVDTYTKNLMKLKNYKNYFFVKLALFIVCLFLGIILTMATLSFILFWIKNGWIKFLVGGFWGILSPSILASFVGIEVKGDTVPNLLTKLAASWLGKKGIKVDDKTTIVDAGSGGPEIDTTGGDDINPTS